jgi:hypothetical protein
MRYIPIKFHQVAISYPPQFFLAPQAETVGMLISKSPGIVFPVQAKRIPGWH